jgi:hypothetical protein
MTLAYVNLLNPAKMAEFYFAKDPVGLAKECLAKDYYLAVGEFEVSQTGEAAAEEMFDMTNNPSRIDERLASYGSGRSISVGDIITVDGVNYLCASFGWEKI